MHLAALPARPLKVSLNGATESLVIITGHQPHAVQASRLQVPKQLVIGRFALRLGHIHRDQLDGSHRRAPH